MKKKNLKKISKYIFDSVREREKNDRLQTPQESYNWCEYDQEVTKKFIKLFNGIMNYTDNIQIDYSENHISIHTESIPHIKKTPPNTISENDYLKLEISKTGFVLNRGYKKVSRYKDENIFNELINIVKDKVKEINANNFNDIYDKVNKESGLLRDSNIDEIFNQ